MSAGANLSFVDNIVHFPLTKVPFDVYSTITYVLPASLSYIVVATLVMLPGTRTLRIALWPLIALLAFRAAVCVDFSNGDPQSTYLNVDFALVMLCVAIRTLEWTFLKEPLKRHLRPANSTSPSIILDALDLATNVRGIGWNWSKSVYVPPETRPTSSRLVFCSYVFFSAIFHGFICGTLQIAVQAFSPEAFTVLNGGSIFDEGLPPSIRYVRSSIIAVVTMFGIYTVMQFNYDVGTILGVVVFRQDPAQWPPVFQAPWMATSLRDFWSRRWHQMFRRSFIVLGGWPLSFISGHAGYILGSFLASGIFHNVVVLMLNGSVEMGCMLLSFGMMATGIVLEDVFTRFTGRTVGGWKGRLWTAAWLLVWGNLMVDGFARAGMFASSNVLDSASPARAVVERHVFAFDRWLHTFV
ncbi:hypothetical protein V8B97DRAFT_1876111 [Scleroderma yunnanense]